MTIEWPKDYHWIHRITRELPHDYHIITIHVDHIKWQENKSLWNDLEIERMAWNTTDWYQSMKGLTENDTEWTADADH